MIINLFKTNQVTGIIFLFIFQSLLFINAFIHPSLPLLAEGMTPAYASVFVPVQQIHWLNLTLSFLLIFVQALMYNVLVIQLNILGKTTYLPAFFYVLVMCMLPRNIYLNPVTIGNIFVLGALYSLLFAATGNKKEMSHVFNMSFIFSLGSVFYLPLIFFAGFAWIALALLTKFTFRQFIVSLVAAALPYLYLFTYYFWTDNLEQWWKGFLVPAFGWIRFPDTFHYAEFAIYGLIVLLLAMSFVVYQSTRYGYKVIQRKTYRVFGYFLLFAVLSAVPVTVFRRVHLELFAFPVGVFLSFYFLNLRKQWIADVITVLMFTLIVVLQFEFY